jgi:hypothetical protein
LAAIRTTPKITPTGRAPRAARVPGTDARRQWMAATSPAAPPHTPPPPTVRAKALLSHDLPRPPLEQPSQRTRDESSKIVASRPGRNVPSPIGADKLRLGRLGERNIHSPTEPGSFPRSPQEHQERLISCDRRRWPPRVQLRTITIYVFAQNARHQPTYVSRGSQSKVERGLNSGHGAGGSASAKGPRFPSAYVQIVPERVGVAALVRLHHDARIGLH